MHFIFDIDGTLCFDGLTISPAIQHSLDELERQGHTIGFASARPYRDILHLLDERFHNKLFVGSNGAMTYQQGELCDIQPLPRQTMGGLFELTEKLQASFLVDLPWHYHFSGDEDHPLMSLVDPQNRASRVPRDDIRLPVKLLVTTCNDIPGLHQALAERDDIAIHHHSDQQIVDITAAGVDKMAALRRHGISPEQLVCFGNDSNDLPMFSAARHTVQVGEHPQLKPLATEQILRDAGTELALIGAMRRLGERYAA
ncbi:HAD-IIB family hydrolase [Chromobacterium sp. IIBBL 290-4]|uniref:HAD-IIB family hydrolase n=1 Tax=Chromobacterium sp. IIBBL 290-4 TaxID=2953890 RepID=UPI0020B80E80|nr:HAD-IIB family hydrolase [Chromobacterium sp. IIBBL 290-4]UTH72893.1 HAD-IIB family hydrolase [Chromobacterium sp. IIBBL 290-4]